MMTPLTRRLSHYVDFTSEEREMLAAIQQRERRFRRGEVLVREGQALDHILVVKSGWLHSSGTAGEDQRQIFRFHFAGDVVSLPGLAWAETSQTVTAVEDGTVASFPKPLLGQIFRQQPRLAALFHALAGVEYVTMCDRLLSLGRYDAFRRIAVLLLEIWSRLKVVGEGGSGRFHLPLRQADIADAVGLTKVHVNRVLRDMAERGIIERDGRTFRIVDPAALIATTGFIDRYEVVATDWFYDRPAYLPDYGQQPAAVGF